MGVEINGLREFQRWADGLAAEIEGEVFDYIEESAFRMEAESKRLVPVDTGTLRNSINTDVDRGSGRIKVILGTNLEYAPYVEFGTSRRAAQPFLTPVYVQYKGKIPNDLRRIVRGGTR